ncbi:MAG: ROK family protein [Bacteroidales bacterium]|nr:ROK family protein [Bacteroidales bacterium]
MEAFPEISGSHYAAEKKRIMSLCNNRKGYCIADLARRLDASIPKVTRIVTEMMADGYLVELGKVESSGGRRASLFGLNPNVGYFAGIHVGHEGLTLAVTDFPGNVLHTVENIPFGLENTEESVHRLGARVRSSLETLKIDLSRIVAYGVDLTGRVNHQTGYSYSYFISEQKPIRTLLEEEFGRPVVLENDTRAMAWGEYVCGVAGDEGTILFLNVGWGLGMGMVLDGKLFYGKSGFSGEVGHFPLLSNNQYCRCGKIGCLETGASGLALHRLVTEKLAQGRTSILSPAYKKGDKISLDSILGAIDREDVLAIECIEEVGATLGHSLAGLINIFNPDLVIIGGRLSCTERYLLPPLRSTVNKYSLNIVNNDTHIKVSQLGRTAGAIGSSLLAKSLLLGNIE